MSALQLFQAGTGSGVLISTQKRLVLNLPGKGETLTHA